MKRAATLKPPKRTSRRAEDPDNPPWTEEMLGLGRDVVEHFRAGGRDYQARMNKVLRDALRAIRRSVAVTGVSAETSARGPIDALHGERRPS